MSYAKVKGASEKVGKPFTQSFAKHAPKTPASKKLGFKAKPTGKLVHAEVVA